MMGSQVINPTHALSFGNIPNLISRTATYSSGYWFDTMAEETDFGTPEPVEVAIRQLLDGSVTEITGHDNRQIVLRVTVYAEDATSLANGELALAAEVGGRNVLGWTPPQPGAAASYFDVVSSSLESVTDMPRELMTMRVYRLHLTCLPFSRPPTPTVTAALTDGSTPPAQTLTTINNASATTNWTGSVLIGGTTSSVTPTAGTGASGDAPTGTVLASYTGTASQLRTMTLTYTPGTSVAIANPYLVVKATKFRGAWASKISAFTVQVKTTTNPSFMPINLVSTAADSYYYDASGLTGNVTAIQISAVLTANPTGKTAFYVDNLAWSNVSSAGSRQLPRTLTVKGSARTQGSLALEHQTNALGHVLVHTGPSDTPAANLRQYRTAGATVTSDSTRISLASEPLNGATPATFVIPASDCPDGPYQLMAHLTDTSPGTARTITWTVASQIAGSDIGTVQTGTVTYTFSANSYRPVPLALVTLPPTALGEDSAGAVRISLSCPDASVILDEAWRFYAADDCALTWISGAGQRVWIDTADVDHPLPQIWTGTASDRSDSYAASVSAWGEHVFTPGTGFVFTVTSGAAGTAVSLQHYRRYHTHVVDEGA